MIKKQQDNKWTYIVNDTETRKAQWDCETLGKHNQNKTWCLRKSGNGKNKNYTVFKWVATEIHKRNNVLSPNSILRKKQLFKNQMD